MTLNEITSTIVAGGLLGALGQGIRMVAGLKKLNDEKAARAAATGEQHSLFNGGRILVSLGIGFVAGAVGMLVKSSGLPSGTNYATETIVTIIAVGYSGADFIEGLFATYVQRFSATSPLVITPQSAGQAIIITDEAGKPPSPPQG